MLDGISLVISIRTLCAPVIEDAAGVRCGPLRGVLRAGSLSWHHAGVSLVRVRPGAC